jgi:hypothetical protein
MTAGKISVMNLTNAMIATPPSGKSAINTGTIFVQGGTLSAANLYMAMMNGYSSPNAASATVSISSGGTVTAGTIVAGGGTSTITFASDGGTLVITNTAGTPAAPLSTLNLNGGTLQLDLNAASSVTNIVATSVTTGDPTVINIGSIVNFSGSTTNFPLISYTGADPYSYLSLGTVPIGYTSAMLVDDTAKQTIDLDILSTPVNSPVITTFSLSDGNLVFSGTNGSAGNQYYLLTSTNVTTPLAQWTPVVTNTFSGGNFSLTNPVNGAAQQSFYILKVQ